MKTRGDFHFKQFSISHDRSTHKVGTDGVLLGAWANVEFASTILDIGTGSGVIAIMLAQRTGAQVTIDGIDLQAHDAQQAESNAKRSPWSERINIIHSSVQDFRPSYQYDLIVSNPPYFIKSWLPPDEHRTKARHTEELTFPVLLENIDRLLKPGGKFAVVLPFNEGNQFIALASQSNFFISRKMTFRSRQEKPIERLLIEFSRQEVDVTMEELVLYVRDEEWTDDYRALTKDFYLKA